MVSVILSTIPIGLGIALNPVVVVAGILIMRSAHARRNGLAFAAGWVLGMVFLVILGAWLAHFQMGFGRIRNIDPPSLVWVAIGTIVLMSAALRILRGQPLPGEEPRPPRWLRMVGNVGVGQSLGIGLFLATVSVRNLALLAAASSVIGVAGLGLVERGITIAAFVAVASLGILIPLSVALFGGERADAILKSWGDWLTRHMGTITAVVMGAIGLYLLVKGVAGLE